MSRWSARFRSARASSAISPSARDKLRCMDALFAQIARLLAEDKPFALGTVIHTAGSTPQKAGARAIFLEGGEILGTLGGGCMEAEARRRGLQMVNGGEPDLMELHLDD